MVHAGSPFKIVADGMPEFEPESHRVVPASRDHPLSDDKRAVLRDFEKLSGLRAKGGRVHQLPAPGFPARRADVGRSNKAR
jgi:hypothetical protein